MWGGGYGHMGVGKEHAGMPAPGFRCDFRVALGDCRPNYPVCVFGVSVGLCVYCGPG